MGLIAQVVSQLDLHRALHQPLGQLAQQAARAGDLLLGLCAGEQLIDQLVGQQRLDLVGELGAGSGRARSASAALRAGRDACGFVNAGLLMPCLRSLAASASGDEQGSRSECSEASTSTGDECLSGC